VVTAEVIPSLAMLPHQRTINGYQAACLDHEYDGERYVIGDRLEEGVWMGDWYEHWIDARCEAIVHNMEVHRSSAAPPLTDWLTILRGP
jgi:hypothetical protein